MVLARRRFINGRPSNYGGLDVSDARKLKALGPETNKPETNKPETNKLKKLLAEQMLDNAMLKDINSKSGDARGQAGSCGSSL